jgi:hypothetical protein
MAISARNAAQNRLYAAIKFIYPTAQIVSCQTSDGHTVTLEATIYSHTYSYDRAMQLHQLAAEIHLDTKITMQITPIWKGELV